MSPGSSTESYPAFARIGLRQNPGKNFNQVTCPDRDSKPGQLVSKPDALTVTPQHQRAFVAAGGYVLYLFLLHNGANHVAPLTLYPFQRVLTTTDILHHISDLFQYRDSAVWSPAVDSICDENECLNRDRECNDGRKRKNPEKNPQKPWLCPPKIRILHCGIPTGGSSHPMPKLILEKVNYWIQFKTHITLTLPDIDISKPEDIDHADETFVQVLEAAMNISIPTRKRTTDTRRRLPPNIIKLIKTKRAAHRLFTRTHADEDRRLYRSLQQDVRETIQRFEAHRWKRFIDRLDHNRTHNPKLFWDVIKRIRGKHANSNHPLRDRQHIVYDTPGKLDLLSRTLENIHTTPNHPSFDPQHLAYITHHITQNPDLYEPLPAPLPRSTDDPLIDNITPLDISLELRYIKNSSPDQTKSLTTYYANCLPKH
ncbi:hypothetical protein ANN_21024 [Periplaneta americana]|uniref:RNA-directed DNA polymerase from transposon X-element n=1 Tax=Periplaneta americana TaxID=6978 RepID=A0ABQ8SFC6_PERAM|nr:hypothetical protein ANN_21024 [Periplaneta americana]